MHLWKHAWCQGAYKGMTIAGILRLASTKKALRAEENAIDMLLLESRGAHTIPFAMNNLN